MFGSFFNITFLMPRAAKKSSGAEVLAESGATDPNETLYEFLNHEDAYSCYSYLSSLH